MGAALVAQPGVADVVFTGSTQVARIVQRALAMKDGPIVPLIAETGGINAMLVDSSAQALAHAAHMGNVYINRNMIGAVVGVQPFGGEGLSGTGPKAGGPHYLYRFGAEQTVTVNTAAAGGNAALLAAQH